MLNIHLMVLNYKLLSLKTEIEQIEENTALSASYVGITGGETDAVTYEDKIRDIKNNFDGYETYLYNVSSSYLSSSMGEFPDSAWPKTGSGTYSDPFEPMSSSHSTFTNWYGSNLSKSGQIYSASLYDTNNSNRLVNLLPQHVYEDVQNSYFLDFIDIHICIPFICYLHLILISFECVWTPFIFCVFNLYPTCSFYSYLLVSLYSCVFSLHSICIYLFSICILICISCVF